MRCCVPNCFSNRNVNIYGKKITFHYFPKSPSHLQVWLEALNMTEQPSEWSVVCSEHFKDEEFYRNKSGKKRMKSGATPFKQEEVRVENEDDEPAAYKVCRICLTRDKNFFNIYENDLAGKFDSLVGMPSVTNNRRYPQVVCGSCASIMSAALELKHKALESCCLFEKVLQTESYIKVKHLFPNKDKENPQKILHKILTDEPNKSKEIKENEHTLSLEIIESERDIINCIPTEIDLTVENDKGSKFDDEDIENRPETDTKIVFTNKPSREFESNKPKNEEFQDEAIAKNNNKPNKEVFVNENIEVRQQTNFVANNDVHKPHPDFVFAKNYDDSKNIDFDDEDTESFDGLIIDEGDDDEVMVRNDKKDCEDNNEEEEEGKSEENESKEEGKHESVRVRRRIDDDIKKQIVSLMSQGTHITQVCKMLDISRGTVKLWWDRWCKEGTTLRHSRRRTKPYDYHGTFQKFYTDDLTVKEMENLGDSTSTVLMRLKENGLRIAPVPKRRESHPSTEPSQKPYSRKETPMEQDSKVEDLDAATLTKLCLDAYRQADVQPVSKPNLKRCTKLLELLNRPTGYP